LKIHSRKILRDLSLKTEANEKPKIAQTTEAKDSAKVQQVFFQKKIGDPGDPFPPASHVIVKSV
jgi:hypothetical protein